MSDKVPPHPLDRYDQWFLLEIAESACPPETLPSGPEWGDYEMQAKDGWKVTFSYDGELDCIDHFITPDGVRLDVWGWPECKQLECWPPLMNWRGVGDLVRLRAAYGL